MLKEKPFKSVKNEDEIHPYEKKRRVFNKTVAKGPLIVFDFQWYNLMNEKTIRKLLPQLSMSYHSNKLITNPLPMIFTSINKDLEQMLNLISAFSWEKNIVQFSDKIFLDLYPKDKIVYLTADTDEICSEFDRDCVYIIGCIIDHNSHKNLTRDFALAHGLKMQKLPMHNYIHLDGSHVLTVNQVMDIITKRCDGNSWTDSLMSSIPKRKNPTPITINDINSNDENRKSLFDKCSI